MNGRLSVALLTDMLVSANRHLSEKRDKDIGTTKLSMTPSPPAALLGGVARRKRRSALGHQRRRVWLLERHYIVVAAGEPSLVILEV